jgi:hypothetical protein
LDRDQECNEGGQTTPSRNAPAVLECEQLYADKHCLGGALQVHWMSEFHIVHTEWSYEGFLAFHNTFMTLRSVARIPTISIPLLSQKTIPTSFLAGIWLNFLGLFDECVCNHSFVCSLVSTFRNETQVPSHVKKTKLNYTTLRAEFMSELY